MQSVVQFILTNSLKRSTEVQKFVLETCKGVQGHMAFVEELARDSSCFENSPVRKVALGWYLREAAPRWTSIQLLSCAIEYCKTFES